MKMTIRRGLFETNSSSVHTLTLAESGLEKPNMRIYTRKIDGIPNKCIIVPLEYFGKDNCTYNTQKEKLSYLLTICYHTENCYSIEDLYENYSFKSIEQNIIDYYRENGKELDRILIEKGSENECGFDHQSMDDYSSIWDFPINIKDFVFNKYIALHTDCD